MRSKLRDKLEEGGGEGGGGGAKRCLLVLEKKGSDATTVARDKTRRINHQANAVYCLVQVQTLRGLIKRNTRKTPPSQNNDALCPRTRDGK